MRSFLSFNICLIILVSCGRSKIVFDLVDADNAAAQNSLESCPNGYILVPGESYFSTNNFCVMKYEAKAWLDDNLAGDVSADELDEMDWSYVAGPGYTLNDSLFATHLPVSMLETRPWTLSASDAWSACLNLNSENSQADRLNDSNSDGTYRLISNNEWMSLAYNIENQSQNWSSGIAGVDCLKQGNIGEDSSCNGNQVGFEGVVFESWQTVPSGMTSSTNPLAKFVLSNGEEIWDISGGVEEWVDLNSDDSLFTGILLLQLPLAGGPLGGGGTMNEVELKNLDTNLSFFEPQSFLPFDADLDSSSKIGRFWGGYHYLTGDFTIPIGMARGGKFDSLGNQGGLYRVDFGYATDIVFFPIFAAGNEPVNIGFRCVYVLD